MVMNRVSVISNLWIKGFIEIRPLDWVIFSQGVAFKTVPEQNPSQVRMVFKEIPKRS